MVSAELVAVIITASISSLDLIINAISLCMSGKCVVECCGNKIAHEDTEANLVDLARRMSNPPPPEQKENHDDS